MKVQETKPEGRSRNSYYSKIVIVFIFYLFYN